MYYLNKIAGVITNPLVVAMGGGVFAFLLARVGRRKCARFVGVISVIWLWVWSTPLMSYIVGASLEREFLVDGKVPRAESYPVAEAILLLGGGMGEEKRLGNYAEMWTSADRVWMAAELYKAGKAPKIYATGGCVEQSTGKLLSDFGVPREAVVFDESPRNTEEEAKLLATTLGEGSGIRGPKADGKTRVLLVTSAWHMKRARLMFEKYAPNLEIIPAPRDFENTMGTMDVWSISSVLPSPASLMWNSIAFHEWIGIVGYLLLR